MLPILEASDARALGRLLDRTPDDHGRLEPAVKDILSAVRKRGDRALIEFARKFDGLTRPIELIAPLGTLVNARFPAAVAAGNVETSQRVVDVLMRALARALPKGWAVVLKEHPAQRMAKRDYRFYSRLGRIPNVHLVSRDEDTFTLTENSRAVASITGTPGWEAIFAGRPVIVFGNAYYRGAPGTISVNDPDELAAAIAEVDRGTFPARSNEDILRYLSAIDRCSYEGIVDKVFLRDSDLSEAECIEKYTEILKRLIASPETFDSNG